ncbi:exocyst complex component exo84 [Colletotrichum spaethianum]|uniref:Exocyst complex component exo84 n=1 Tax=Colletotrichum spaethianum TaxID=700344 RepID=A0AA37LM26_9PEZI|nr:exocyst complex component exo84 [Colletotrichum spaethianum]GKT47277.1 exocyst complex component exo84 [Colletotrichum spaethianum]
MSEDRERSKISLRSGKRKARPQISAPRQISEPILQDGSGPPRLRPPPQAGGGKTSDLVKRRYSTRFNNLPNDFDVNNPPVPAMPSLDKYEFRQRRGALTSSSLGGDTAPAPVVDIKTLRDPGLVPDQCGC